MRKFALLAMAFLAIAGCDSDRIFEKNIDFQKRHWRVNEKPGFEFVISDTSSRYNLYFNMRNEVSYPNSNIYFTYYLTDSTKNVLEQKLVSQFLFDQKTGEPFGSSGLGDIYGHKFLLLKDYRFRSAGKYTMQFEQFMRTDTLSGILSVGLRVERSGKDE